MRSFRAVSAAVGLASISITGCGENKPSTAETPKTYATLTLPAAKLDTGTFRFHEVKPNNVLTDYIGEELYSKLKSLKSPLAYGCLFRNGRGVILDSGEVSLKPGDHVFIFLDLAEKIRDFRSSVYGESLRYANECNRICFIRMNAIAEDYSQERTILENQATNKFKSKFIAGFEEYKVKSGDTLNEISEQIIKSAGWKFENKSTKISAIETVTAAIKAANNFKDSELKAGQKITVLVLKKGNDPKDFLRSATDQAIKGLAHGQ